MEWTPNSVVQFSTLFAHKWLLVTERYDAAPPARHLWSHCGKPSVTVVFKISFTTNIRQHLLQFVKNQILTVIQFFSLNHKTKWFKTKIRLSSAEGTKSRGFFSPPLPFELFLGHVIHKYRNDVFIILRTYSNHILVTVIHIKEYMRNLHFIKNVHVRCCPKHISVYQQK